MSIPKYIHGRYEGLPETLASRITFLRDARGIHISELSKKARVPLDQVEELESGIETWMSVAVRQRVANVLKVDPHILEEVEIKIDFNEIKLPNAKSIRELKRKIIRQEENVLCPQCKAPMKHWIQKGFDLLGDPIESAKGNCTECTFYIKST